MADAADEDAMPTLEESTEAERPEVREGGEKEEADSAAAAVAKLELNKKQDVYRLNLGHQETDRILDEIDGSVWTCQGEPNLVCPPTD